MNKEIKKICCRTDSAVTQKECLKRIATTRKKECISLCEQCITAEKSSNSMRKMTLATRITTLKRKQSENMSCTLAPTRRCHSCGTPTNDFECDLCRRQRKAKGI